MLLDRDILGVPLEIGATIITDSWYGSVLHTDTYMHTKQSYTLVQYSTLILMTKCKATPTQQQYI